MTARGAGVAVELKRRFGGHGGLPSEWEVSAHLEYALDQGVIATVIRSCEEQGFFHIAETSRLHKSCTFVFIALPQGTPLGVAGHVTACIAAGDKEELARALALAERISKAVGLAHRDVYLHLGATPAELLAERLAAAASVLDVAGETAAAMNLRKEGGAAVGPTLRIVRAKLQATSLDYERMAYLEIARDALGEVLVLLPAEEPVP